MTEGRQDVCKNLMIEKFCVLQCPKKADSDVQHQPDPWIIKRIHRLLQHAPSQLYVLDETLPKIFMEPNLSP